MAISPSKKHIIGILLITFILAGFTNNPDPDPGSSNGSFISVFDNKRKRADRYFNNFEYKSAIKLYNKLVEKGKADDIVKLRLAESYLKINDLVNAEKLYSEVIHSDQVTPNHQIQYAHTLLSNGKYEEARQVINSYEFADSDYRSQAIINTLDRLEIYYADSAFYHINPIEDNKPQYSDFSPTVFKNGIVFVSSRHDKGPKFKWDETPFLDLYYTETDVASARPFSESLNSKYHEGPIAFYDNYSKAIFTRSNYLNKELGVTEHGINNLQLYTADWDDSKQDWTNIQPVDFIINNYSYGHPAISPDNNRLYFVSDMPGGFGGTDIYVSERNETGWGDPVNMGEVINTAGNEMYPFVDDEGNLYFASNGHGGLGGLDVYQIQPDGNMDLRNMGYPLNTTADDFGFTLNPTGEIAYISSNREGVDNIYKIDIQAPDLELILADNSVNGEIPQLDEYIEPLATSQLSTMVDNEDYQAASQLSTINASFIDENNEVLKDANLKLIANGEEIETVLSDNAGNVTVHVSPDQEYTIVASKDGFEDRIITLPAESLGLQEDLLIVMNPVFMDSDVPGDQLPVNELEPLAVSDEPWEDAVVDNSQRPDISGVALTDLPEFDDVTYDDLPTTELDPLAVSGDGWDQSNTQGNDRPELQGVALTDLPSNSTDNGFVDNSEDDLPTTELDPLAVSDDGLYDNKRNQSDRPEVEGVSLTELPPWTEETPEKSQVSTTELDPLAVTDEGWDQSNLQGTERPELQGVALTDLPSNSEDNGFVDNSEDDLPTTELDPLAVSDEGLVDNTFNQQEQPEISAVALRDLPNWNENPTNKIGEKPATEFDSITDSQDYSDEMHLVETKAVDAITGMPLISADIKLYVDSPDQELEYELKDGTLTFQARPNEDYIIVASHDDYQDQYVTLSGDELLADGQKNVNLKLTQNNQLAAKNVYQNGQTTKFKTLVHDEETGDQLEDAEVKLFVDGKEIESEYSKETGKTVFKSPTGEDYLLLASRKGYQDLIYHLPGAPEENMDVDLVLLREQEAGPYSPNRQLAIKGHAFDDFSGDDLEGVTFKIFENGDLIETTDDLSSLEVDPEKHYQVVAVKDGYMENLQTINRSQLDGDEPVTLPFALAEEQISEVTGAPVYQELDGEAVPISVSVIDITDEQPVSEALIVVFADEQVQERTRTWQSGMVTINTVAGRDYQLLVRREGYSDKLINLRNVERIGEMQIALVPQDIQKLRPSEIDLNNANMLVMTNQTGEEQLYISTSDALYKYFIENDNHYLINDDQIILLKERKRSLDSKVTSKKDSDQFNMRSEDQFLYDQLSADEKAMIDQIVDKMRFNQLEDDPDLQIYYNNLPAEYRVLVDRMAENSQQGNDSNVQSDLPVASNNLNQVLSENHISLGETFNINNIYYDFDKSSIREDAAIELDKLATILKSNRAIKVVMFSHTDSRGSSKYNDELSRRRGIAAVQYLVEQGISIDRLTSEGLGEKQLVNSCPDSIKCSEEAHQLNRRTEFMLST